MTNIDNMSNVEIAALLDNPCKYCIKRNSDYRCFICQPDIPERLLQEAELTADEMFEALGYVKVIDNNIYVGYELFVDKHSFGQVTIYKTEESYAVRLLNREYFAISLDLDKAIHKKMEKLKNGK